jgi:hypothetical protein
MWIEIFKALIQTDGVLTANLWAYLQLMMLLHVSPYAEKSTTIGI